MNFRSGLRRIEPEINLIAFIDVLLVVLIFMMLTTTFNKYTALQITLPVANAGQPATSPAVIGVTVDAQGRYAINGRRLDTGGTLTLARQLKQAAAGNADMVVELDADARATHQSVMNVMEAARLAELPRLHFAAQTHKDH